MLKSASRRLSLLSLAPGFPDRLPRLLFRVQFHRPLLSYPCMKAKQTMTASAAFVALAMTWWHHHRVNCCARQARVEKQQLQDALDTFEGEGGLVLA